MDEDQEGPEYIVISDDEDEDDGDEIPTPPVDVPFPEVIELPRYQIKPGSVIRKGDTVELEDRTGRVADYALSGDFLRIHGIFENLETGEVNLRGYRLRRCSYLPTLFDSKYHVRRSTGCPRLLIRNNRQAERAFYANYSFGRRPSSFTRARA